MSKPESQWQPIETAPKDGTRFLVAWTGGAGDIDFDACSYQAENLQHSRSLGRMRYGTHWMPIPPLPEGER